MATVRSDPGFHKRLARMVSPVTRSVADEIGGRARAALVGHRRTGAASIEVTHGPVDSLVSLVDPAAASIEFGRAGFTRSDGRYVGPMEGLHVLTGSV